MKFYLLLGKFTTTDNTKMSIVLPNVNAAFSGLEEAMVQLVCYRDATVESPMVFQSFAGFVPARQSTVSNIGLGAEIVEKFCIH